jgi:hypothetical protein
MLADGGGRGANSDDRKKAWPSLLFYGTYLVISSGVAPVQQHAGHVIPVQSLINENIGQVVFYPI